MADDWKQVHADEADKAVFHEMVQKVVEEFADNMHFANDGLPRYGMLKIAAYAAQVARAQALGFDPNLLRLSDEEANAQMLAKARMAVAAGKPVWAIEGDRITRLD